MAHQTRISRFFQKAPAVKVKEEQLVGGRKRVGKEEVDEDDRRSTEVEIKFPESERAAKKTRVVAAEPKPAKRDRSSRKSVVESVLDRYSRDGAGEDEVGRNEQKSRRFKDRVLTWRRREPDREKAQGEAGEGGEKGLVENDANNGGSKGSKGGSKFTPLEEQYMKFKEENPDTLLFIECGYKFRFFGEDAEVASKILRIYAHFDHNFMTASIPTHRLPYHLERLVRAGCKAGVVRQIETAALKKAGSNKTGPFVRKLTEVYTLGTLVSDSLGGTKLLNDVNELSRISTAYLAAVFEVEKAPGATSSETGEGHIEFAALDVSTGELIFDFFEDNALRQSLESILTSLEPVEVVIPSTGMSARTEKIVRAYTSRETVRLQHLGKQQFLAEDREEVDDYLRRAENSEVKNCKRALTGLYRYICEFNLQRAMSGMNHITRYGERDSTSLTASVIQSFDVFSNGEDGSSNGTLFSLLNRTGTPFGSRELRRWLSHPLITAEGIRRRQDAVREVSDMLPSKGQGGNEMSALLKKLDSLQDLERSLPKIRYQKCSPAEFLSTMQDFLSLSSLIDEARKHVKFKSEMLSSMLAEVPDVTPIIERNVKKRLNEESAQKNDYSSLFKDDLHCEEVEDDDSATRATYELEQCMVQEALAVKAGVEGVESLKAELEQHLVEIRSELKKPALQWKKIHIEEYLIELSVNETKLAGADWSRINQTKTFVRFRTPQTARLLQTMAEHRERVELSGKTAWRTFLELFDQYYDEFRAVVRFIAVLDVLAALARVAGLPDYCYPRILDVDAGSSGILAREARHPVVDSVNPTFVPNDIELGLSGSTERAMVVTGPNMGGKSTYVRSVALIAIMAQVGCCVPASEMELAPFNSFFARIGASDNISKGLSTFMVELTETAEILRMASRRSLVVIDELGRGTSTHDGTAISYSTLEFLLEDTQSTTLFVTHYPIIAKLAEIYPSLTGVFHMSYIEQPETVDKTEGDEYSRITFLYKIKRGLARKSYGLNVARMASLPPQVIRIAANQAGRMENATISRSMQAEFAQSLRNVDRILHKDDMPSEDAYTALLEEQQDVPDLI